MKMAASSGTRQAAEADPKAGSASMPGLAATGGDTTFPVGVGVRAGYSPIAVPAAQSDLESASDQTVGPFAGEARVETCTAAFKGRGQR